MTDAPRPIPLRFGAASRRGPKPGMPSPCKNTLGDGSWPLRRHSTATRIGGGGAFDFSASSTRRESALS